MKELLIDSSTNLLYVGLNNNGIVDTETRIGNNDNAAYLVDKIDKLLSRNSLKIDDISSITVGVGPGSYTGIRVAVTVAKMLSYTKKIKLKTVSSLLLLSSGYDKLITAAIDARRNHVFTLTHKLGEILSDDQYIDVTKINNDILYLTEDNIKVNFDVIRKVAIIVKDVHSLEPNYLRKTEAETNYDKKS